MMNQNIENLVMFFCIAFFWRILDSLTGNFTDITTLMVISFFLVWNNSQGKKKAPPK